MEVILLFFLIFEGFGIIDFLILFVVFTFRRVETTGVVTSLVSDLSFDRSVLVE